MWGLKINHVSKRGPVDVLGSSVPEPSSDASEFKQNTDVNAEKRYDIR